MCQQTTATYTIPEHNLPLFGDRIAALNKRARKLGVPEIGTAVTPAYLEREFLVLTASGGHNARWVKDGDPAPRGAAKAESKPTGRVRQWHSVTVTGQAPKFNGWTFIATLEPIAADDGAALNLLRCVPGEECPAEFRDRVGECDHCKAKRTRKQTFVVRHDSGEHKMVGRQCVRDFLGHSDPHKLASWAELLAELGALANQACDEEWGMGGGGGDPAFDLVCVLAWTAGVIDRNGWVSRAVARDDERRTATADVVAYLLGRPPRDRRDREAWDKQRADCCPTDAHQSAAEAAREWAREFSDEQITANNYLANCNAIARAGIVNVRAMGVACSIIASFQREQAKQATEAKRSNDFVGEVGKRSEFIVTVDRIVGIESAYGEKGLHLMTDEAGNALVWFASGANWLTVGGKYKIAGSVKDHKPYKGRNQTTLSRVKVVEEIGGAA